MRVLISGGGTGGHVYPALAVVTQLNQINLEPVQSLEKAVPPSQNQPNLVADSPVNPDPKPIPAPTKALKNQPAARPNRNESEDILWVGSTDGMEAALVQRAGLPYRGIDTGQLRGMNPIRFVANLGKIARGLRQSLTILDDFQPEVCFVTGGYVCAPVIAACRLRGIPVLIYLPDMKPGWAIQWMSKLAQRVAISFPAVAAHFGGEYPQGKAVVTGYPVRAEMTDLVNSGTDRGKARIELAQALDRPLQQDDKPLVLIFGGSQGARSINHAIWKCLPALLPDAHLLHVVGTRDWPLYEEALPSLIDTPHFYERYHPVAYLHDEMILALLAADVAVARAGASTLGEFPIARLPSLLVPLPFAGVNQVQNAEALAAQGAALVLQDDTLSETLGDELRNLLRDHSKRIQMEAALGRLAQPDAALKIVQELYKLAIWINR